MKQWKQKLKYGAAVVVTSALPVIAYANDLTAEPITSELAKSKPIIIAVAGAIFGLIGLVVAIAYAKRTAK